MKERIWEGEFTLNIEKKKRRATIWPNKERKKEALARSILT